jgi:hypothetical protein
MGFRRLQDFAAGLSLFNQINSVTSSHLPSVRSILILSSLLSQGPFKIYLISKIIHQNFVCISYVRCVIHALPISCSLI